MSARHCIVRSYLCAFGRGFRRPLHLNGRAKKCSNSAPLSRPQFVALFFMLSQALEARTRKDFLVS